LGKDQISNKAEQSSKSAVTEREDFSILPAESVWSVKETLMWIGNNVKKRSTVAANTVQTMVQLCPYFSLVSG